MNIYPAIDLYEGAAVRLFQGNYNQMTVYADNPVHTAADFKEQGSSFLHLVDLEGAKKRYFLQF
jgi:phosphoribosylformimino-5-aminoimidazole carboxamide ribotide isomerase